MINQPNHDNHIENDIKYEIETEISDM